MERCGHLRHICVLCSAFTGDNRCLYRHLYYGQEEFEGAQKAFFEKGNFNSLREGSPVQVFGRLLPAVLYIIRHWRPGWWNGVGFEDKTKRVTFFRYLSALPLRVPCENSTCVTFKNLRQSLLFQHVWLLPVRTCKKTHATLLQSGVRSVSKMFLTSDLRDGWRKTNKKPFLSHFIWAKVKFACRCQTFWAVLKGFWSSKRDILLTRSLFISLRKSEEDKKYFLW